LDRAWFARDHLAADVALIFGRGRGSGTRRSGSGATSSAGGLAASAEDEKEFHGPALAAATLFPLPRDGAAASSGLPVLASCVVGSFRVGPV
jgi:hypothetical protein